MIVNSVDDILRDLEEQTRFDDYEIMFYRSNNKIHTKMMQFMFVTAYLQGAFKGTELNDNDSFWKMYYGILFHDFPETKTGDLSTLKKAKMSPEEHRGYVRSVENAIDILAPQIKGDFFGFDPKELMLGSLYKEELVYQMISLIDKEEGYCSVRHDVEAGNPLLLFPAIDYPRRINELYENYPDLEKFKGKHLLFSHYPDFDFNNYEKKMVGIVKKGKKFCSVGSLARKTDDPLYKYWKDCAISNNKLVIPLTNQKEFWDGTPKVYKVIDYS